MGYKFCSVPSCANTTHKTPDKLFVSVPKNVEMRRKWLRLADRNPDDLSATSNLYFCEDHFDIKKDMANYYRYKMGFSRQKIMVNGVLPSKFDRRKDRETEFSKPAREREYILPISEEALSNEVRIKREGECCVCFGGEDLFSLLEPYRFEENVEIYSTMIAECFQIELDSYEELSENSYLICKNCVLRLRDSIALRSRIRTAYDRLRVERSIKKEDRDDVSSESDLLETKEHILKCDISERDMNVNPEASLSNENESRFKSLKVVLEKIDNSTLKNTSIVSAGVAKSPSKLFVCNICSKLFRNLRDIQKHKRFHRYRNAKIKRCRYCYKGFKSNHYLLEHEKIHLDIKDFTCDYCNREFSRKRTLTDHILLHMGCRNVKCDLCDKYFVSNAALTSHRRIHSFRLSCNICGKTLRSKMGFEQHALLHSDVKYECQICRKTFLKRRSLITHYMLHGESQSNRSLLEHDYF